MVRKISDKKTQLMQELYDKGLDVVEIARRVNVSYSTAYGYTKLKQRINPETGRKFESISQLRDYQARHRINPETGQAFESRSQYEEYRARHMFNLETGQAFESRSQYEEYRARHRINPETRKAFESRSQLMDYQARHRINPETAQAFESRSQYEEYRARHRINPETGQAFESRSQYEEYLAEQRQRRLKNKKLSNLIKKRLKKLRKNQSWLSREVDVSKETASMYTHGKSIPTEERLERLFSALGVKCRTLEDLLEEKH